MIYKVQHMSFQKTIYIADLVNFDTQSLIKKLKKRMKAIIKWLADYK